LTPEEGYEFLIVQTRKLADGFFRDPSKASDMNYTKTKDREISKAILRTMSAYYLLFGDKKGLTSDFKDMHEQGKFIFKVKKLAHEKLSWLKRAKNFILRKKPEKSTYEKLLEKALRVRYEDEMFDLDKDTSLIYKFFNETINEFKQIINDEVDLDIQFNEDRQKRLADYYERNTAALAEKISKTKNIG
ncbi:MAG: hypothetical protein QXH80_03645, partial [Candidatus Nanoarchaeia archaeon]